MAYDADLAERLRELLATEPEVVEKRMFGGLAFLVAGNMAVAASREGGSCCASTRPAPTSCSPSPGPAGS
jgi:hypothetical protein